MTRPFFSKDRITDFELFDRHADHMISKIKERLRQGIAVDIQDALSRFTLDTATEFLFARNVQSLSAELPYPSTHKGRYTRPTHPSDEFAAAFTRAQELTLPRTFYGVIWPLFEFWQDAVTAKKDLTDKFINPVIDAALQKKKAANGVYELDKDGGCLLDHLVNQTDGAISNSTYQFIGLYSTVTVTTDYEIIKDETFNVMLAGRDTVRSSSLHARA